MIRSATPCLIATSMIFALACDERPITIGPDLDTGGNYWGRNVSKKFERAELAALHKGMNSPGTKQEIVDLNCGKALASHEYSVTLWPEGAHRERIVRLQMTPRLYEGDECLQEVVNYVFQRNVKAMDPGPPIDYGYKDPLTGKPLGPSEDILHVPEKPHCICAPSSSELQPAVTQGGARCPSFDALGRLVDERVLAIKPGVSLREFTTSGPARHALNFWDDVAGGLRETGFYVPVSEGNTIVSDQVVCRFDKQDILVSCKRECCRDRTRSITLEQYNSLTIGEPRAEVERRLCTPSDSEREGTGRVNTYYHIPLPIGHHDEGQTVMLVFDSGRLSSKSMSPYY